MSDIKVGDWVMVVRPMPCCGSRQSMGTMFSVVGTWHNGAEMTCSSCGAASPEPIALRQSFLGQRVSRLMRIDPPPLVPGVETGAEVV